MPSGVERICDTYHEEHLEELTRRIVNKLLHDPPRMLRQAEEMPGGVQYLNALEKLFRLQEALQQTQPSDAASDP